MRIVSYNILDGGEGRADPLAEVIVAQRADVVALIEADHEAVLDRIARRLGMDFIHAPNREKSAALLSRWPIAWSVNHGPLRSDIEKSLLEAAVDDPAGGQWVLGVVHLHARAAEADEAQREVEIAAVLEIFARHRAAGQRHVLLGDFNANAPSQQIDPARCKPGTREAWEANGGKIPRRVVQAIMEAGYVDVLRAVRGRAADTMGTFSTQHPGQRVDYIFAWGVEQSALSDAWIETDRLARYASDHYPVGAEIK